MCDRLVLLLALCSACAPTPDAPAVTALVSGDLRRMPAEWEPQAAVWLQWPHPKEGRGVQTAFAGIVTAIVAYEDVHLLVNDDATRDRALRALDGVPLDRVTFHTVPTDSSWMRDNGPRYVEVDGARVVQNWVFNAWGGGFGAVPYANDDRVPDAVAAYLTLPVESVGLVHERGDLEVNGADTAIVNWSVLSQRNPTLSRDAITTALQDALGVTSVVMVEGFDRRDGTRGHVDGMLRFVSDDTVLVGQDGSPLMDDIADQIATQRPDLTVTRLVSPDASIFLNYLIGDGFVLVATSGHAAEDDTAQGVLAQAFPDREVRFVNVDALWRNGGGIHCVTNDEPAD